MDKRILFLFNFVVLICAKVEWKVDKRISAYGEELRLLCTTEEYSVDGGKIKRWGGGPKQKMLTLNGAPDQEDVMKYNMSMRQDGFDLVIKNVTEVDLNVTYECTYGFKSSGKVILKIEDAFKAVKHSKRENEQTNNVIIYVMIVILLVLAAVCILFFLRKKGKLPLPYICGSNANSVHRHGRDLPSGGPQETDQFIPQPNGFVSHHSNGEVVQEANKDDSLPSQQIMGNRVGVIEDVPVKSKPHSEAELVTKTSTAERGNTELIGEILDDTSLKNVSTLKDLASATFTEVNEESLPQQQNAGHEEENKEDVPDFVSVSPNQSELVTSVAATRSKTLEPYNTEPGWVSVDETSLKDVTASSDITASDPDRGFQYITSDVQETKKNSPGHIKFRKEYLSSFVRKKSFNSPLCEWSLSNPSIKQMAKAGFFCSGYETSAQCFSCGAKRCWQEGDDPFHEHFHDSCRHLKHIKETQASGEGS